MENIIEISEVHLAQKGAFSPDREIIKLYSSTFIKGKMIFPLTEKAKAFKYCQERSTNDKLMYLMVENESDYTIWKQQKSASEVSANNLNDLERKKRYELDAILETLGDW